MDTESKIRREAGRIVMAYFTGYGCKYASINKNGANELASCDFGNDELLVDAVLSYRNSPDTYDKLSYNDKKKCQDVALKTIIVISGGAAAESALKNKTSGVSTQHFFLTSSDVGATDDIDFFLSMVKQGQHPGNYQKMVYKQVLKLMEEPSTISAVSALSDALAQSEENKLEKKEVEKLLVDTGFLSYVCRLRQGVKEGKPSEPQPQSTPEPQPSQQGFSREELEKMKKSMENKPLTKEEAISKISNFIKSFKNGSFLIGLADDIERELFDSGRIDKSVTSNYITLSLLSHSAAKEVLTYFVCLGMGMSPDSSKSGISTQVYVLLF
ncbi:MAG: hypothetical protein ACOX2F_11870 [bacterium]